MKISQLVLFSSLVKLLRLPIVLSLVACSSTGFAATAPAYWTNNCMGCHGAEMARSEARNLSANMGSAASLSAYISGLGLSVPMTNFPTNATAGEIQEVWTYFKELRGNVSTQSISFAATTVAASTQTDFTITNYRSVAAAYTLGAMTGSHTGDFAVTSHPSCVNSVPASADPAGTSCTITVTFTPSAAGARSASLPLTFDASSTPVALSGVGNAPTFSITASTLSPTATAGTTTTTSTTISNSGTLDLVLGASALTFAGTHATEFSLGGGNNCTPSLILAPAGSCTLVVQFAPVISASGARSATLAIAHNATGSPSTVTINGTADAVPVIAVNATEFIFTATPLGQHPTKTLIVSNSGLAPLVFSGITLSGSAAADYAIATSGTCSTSTPLAASAQCTVVITFTPTSLADRPATLTVTSNASNAATRVIPISVAVPGVTLAPSSPINFGTQTLGGLYQARTITLTNSGTSLLNVSALSISGSAFTLVDAQACASPIAVSGTCSIQVRFTPVATNPSYSETLSLTSDADGTPHLISLVGAGTNAQAPVLTWLPTVSAVNFGTVAVGTFPAPTQTIRVSNSGLGGVMLKVANAVGTDPTNFTVTLSGCAVGSVLYEGSTCDVIIGFVPGSAGAKTAYVQIGSSGSPPTEVVLSGSGLGDPSTGLSLSSSVLAFGGIRVNAQSAPQEITLTSNGVDALHVTALAVTGPYTVSNRTCPATPFDLAPGADCTVTVSFDPTTNGTGAGTLSVTSNAPSTTMTVALDGQGEAAPDVTSGGCSLATGQAPTDPTLWALVLAAAAVLARRRLTRQSDSAAVHNERRKA